MADDAPAPTPTPGVDYNAIIQQIMQGGSGISGPAAPATPAVNPNLPITSLLGEALGGGVSPLYPMSEAQQTQAGNAALLNFGINMLQNSSGPVRHSLGQAIASGLLGAQGSLAGVREGQAQTLDVQNKQQQMNLERLKVAMPLLQYEIGSKAAADALNVARGGGGGGAPGGGGTLAATGTPIGGAAPAFTGDLEKDRQIIAQHESGGDPTALNYVAKADPTAYGRGATASGKYQFVNSSWQDGLKLAGLDPSKYPTAMSAPESVQDQVFTAVYKRDGTKPWDPTQWKQNWVPTPTGQMILANVAPGSAPGGGGPPAPYKVAGPAVAPPGGAPAAPAPVGNLGLVRKPDGTVGTPGGGFGGTPPAPTATAAAPPVTPPAAPAQQPPPPSPYPDVTSGDVTIRHPGSPGDYLAQNMPPTALPPQVQAEFDRRLNIAGQMVDPAGKIAEINKIAADRQAAMTAQATADRTAVQGHYDEALKNYNTAANSRFGFNQDIVKGEAERQGAANQKMLEPFQTGATQAQQILPNIQQAKQVLAMLPDNPVPWLQNPANRDKLAAIEPYLPTGWQNTLKGADLFTQVMGGIVSQMGANVFSGAPGGREAAYNQFATMLPTLAQSASGREQAMIQVEELAKRRLAENTFLQKYALDPANRDPERHVANMGGALDAMNATLPPMLAFPSAKFNPAIPPSAPKVGPENAQRYASYWSSIKPGQRYIGYAQDEAGAWHPRVGTRAPGQADPRVGLEE